MNYTYYPYGNAREQQNPDGSWSFTCQHGSNECKANMIFVCAMHYHSDPSEFWPFVACVEDSSSPADSGSKCANSVGWKYDEIEACTTSKLGNSLQHQVAVATDSLVPKHQWTPWVVMNGKPLSQSQLDQSLVTLVCNAYKGSDKPSACNRIEVCLRK